MIYRIIATIRNSLYDNGALKSVPSPVPTICVGNITVGGTGKTPHTEMILRTLLSDDFWGARQFAVLSRGYKRKSRGFQQVMLSSKALFCGDEPLQIKKKFPQVTVAVDKDRVEACGFLADPSLLQSGSRRFRRCVDKEMPATDLIVLDDAFQYRKLKATCNLVLVNYNRPLHKDKFLPFGRLRDLPSRIKDADIIIVTKCPYGMEPLERFEWASSLGLSSYNPLTCKALAKNGKTCSLFFSKIEYDSPVPVFPESDIRYAYSKRAVLFTGIASDKPLRLFLSDSYKIEQNLAFPDHHAFSAGNIADLERCCRHWPTAAFLTTEKDAQRMLDCKKVPASLRERMLMVPIRAEFLTEEERHIFKKELLAAIGRP